MQKNPNRSKKALGSLSLIILLLIAAIIGGVISYLWVTGYYMSLKANIPNEGIVAITNLSFNPENATAFNVTLLNPSYSPSKNVGVAAIGYEGSNENIIHVVQGCLPALAPFNLTRGTSQTFTCVGNLTGYVNQTLVVSVYVMNGSGATSFIKIPYTKLLVSKIDFNSTTGVNNFKITLRNAPLSAANLTITTIGFYKQPVINNTFITPRLPYTLAPNKTVTLLVNQSWFSYATTGGSFPFVVSTKEGYTNSSSVQIPQLASSIQKINFNENDTNHFTVTVKNKVSTNTPLNVSSIEVTMDNGTVKNVTPALKSSTNGILGNSMSTFTASWNWTRYRDRSAGVTVFMLQGVNASGQQITPALSILNTTFPDSQHVLVRVENSQYSAEMANVTKITVTLENGTEKQVQIIQPPASPYLIGIGNVTLFNCYWNWQNYLNKTVTVNIYTTDGLVTSYTTRTPLANYTVYLAIPSTPVFSTSNTTAFNVTVQNSQASSGNATITRITVLLANGTERETSFMAQTLTPNSTLTFTCTWKWATYGNENIVICVYTNEGLGTIYVMKTP